jgi:hypothetical protein
VYPSAVPLRLGGFARDFEVILPCFRRKTWISGPKVFLPALDNAPRRKACIRSISGSLGATTSGMIGGYPASISIQGDNLVLNVVPEPSALALLGGAVLALLGHFSRWFRNR